MLGGSSKSFFSIFETRSGGVRGLSLPLFDHNVDTLQSLESHADIARTLLSSYLRRALLDMLFPVQCSYLMTLPIFSSCLYFVHIRFYGDLGTVSRSQRHASESLGGISPTFHHGVVTTGMMLIRRRA